jgi:hypothetical protein
MRESLVKGEIVVATAANRYAVYRAVQAGKLRQLVTRLYTSNLKDDPASIVRRNVWHVTAGLLPGALIADRTALESRPAADGSVFVVTDRSYDITLPGIVIRTRKGIGPIPESDRPFIGGLWMSSQPRALLDNFRPSRERKHVRPTLTRAELEKWLETLARRGGEDRLNALRDEARHLAPILGREEEYDQLSSLIGTLLGTRTAELVSDSAKALSAGVGYDTDRLELFEELRTTAASSPFPSRPARASSSYLPFFEAYFSNFIEGTEFEVSEAYDIIFHGVIPEERPEDAHDILSTFRIVSDYDEMRRVASTPNEFLELLRYRHSVIMEGRPSCKPGQFKTKSNRWGDTLFVEPSLVVGTLQRGFEILQSLESPMARAAFAMFLISEVHPFADGNGRMARIMMNAELVHAGQERVIIPTVFRSEYIQSLKALSHNNRAGALLDVLNFAQRYVAAVDFSDYSTAFHTLSETHAFGKPADAMGIGDKLVIPSSKNRVHI